MRRASAFVGSAVFLVIAPGVAAGLAPYWITRWQLQPAWLGWEGARLAGAALALAGLPGLLDSFVRFAVEGLGTPAPLAPPRKLVASGLYRHVRNPMYVSVLAMVFGQAVLLCDQRLLAYGALLWLAFHVFVVVYEEPALKRSFGAGYEAYLANVPRWVPRIRPWRAQ